MLASNRRAQCFRQRLLHPSEVQINIFASKCVSICIFIAAQRVKSERFFLDENDKDEITLLPITEKKRK